MKTKPDKANQDLREKDTLYTEDQQGYPSYPPGQDIYGKYHKARNINPEDPPNIKKPVDKFKTGANNEKDFSDDVSGNDLDIPGSEPDDEFDFTGSEDEENNYYSLGGDDHNDLDEANEELNFR
jgi:hypothetical protein